MTIEGRNLMPRTSVGADTDTRATRPNSRLVDDASVSALRAPPVAPPSARQDANTMCLSSALSLKREL